MPKSDARSPVAAAPDSERLRLTAEMELLREQVARLTKRLAEAERLADRDVLTPLLNRRAFLREVERAIAIARRYKAPASVIFLDLNGFKDVNDRYGHAAGDAVLVAVAERLLAAVRAEDVVGRIGGDEFAVLLQRADAHAASLKAWTLREGIATEPVVFHSQQITVGVAYGVREISGADSAEQAIAEADANMYLRKPSRER